MGRTKQWQATNQHDIKTIIKKPIIMQPLIITGIIKSILPVQGGVGKSSGKAWQKQDFVIETIEQYPRLIAVSAFGRVIDQLPKHLGVEVEVDIDIESREHNGRWFSSINARYIKQTAYAQPPATYQQAVGQNIQAQSYATAESQVANPDLPF